MCVLCLLRFEMRASILPDRQDEGMNEGKSIFSQLIGFLSSREFRRCVARYGGNRYPRPCRGCPPGKREMKSCPGFLANRYENMPRT